jgi:hypothetical protein
MSEILQGLLCHMPINHPRGQLRVTLQLRDTAQRSKMGAMDGPAGNYLCQRAIEAGWQVIKETPIGIEEREFVSYMRSYNMPSFDYLLKNPSLMRVSGMRLDSLTRELHLRNETPARRL